MLDKTKPQAENTTEVKITAPNLQRAKFRLIGKSPYMQSRFTEKAKAKMRETQEAGSQARSKRKRSARDFKEDFEQAQYISEQGWNGIPAGAFRSAMIDVCRLVGFKMTLAKLSVFVEADGRDARDGTQLVRIISKKGPEVSEVGIRPPGQNMDIRVRPMWRDWEVDLTVRYDEDQFSLVDVTNLLARAGMQCGIGEGRPNSRESYGIGFGTFEISNGGKAK